MDDFEEISNNYFFKFANSFYYNFQFKKKKFNLRDRKIPENYWSSFKMTNSSQAIL